VIERSETERADGLIEISQTYTTIIEGRVVVIYDVPMLQDPETQETLLSPDTAEKLFDLLSHPEYKTGVTSAEVYSWNAPGQTA
jgi:hypothetical protein